MLVWIEQIRPKQWVKNSFVLAAPLFSIFSILWGRAILGAVIFIFISGVVYILNDLLDLERDRHHPQKYSRPLPSGRMTVEQAEIEGFILLCVGSVAALYLSLTFLLIVVLYLIINLAYSLNFKNIPVIDFLCIAIGFVLRAWAGAVAVRIPVTPWFLICIFGLSLFLALRKREFDLNPRYSQSWIPAASQAARIMAGAEYTIFAIQSVFWPTIPLVWAGLYNYSGGVAENEIVENKTLRVILIIFGVSIIALKRGVGA